MAAQRYKAGLAIERARVRIHFAAVSKIRHFHSLHDTSAHSLYKKYLTIDGSGTVSEWYKCVIGEWLEGLQEKSSWCRDEQVCQGENCKVL